MERKIKEILEVVTLAAVIVTTSFGALAGSEIARLLPVWLPVAVWLAVALLPCRKRYGRLLVAGWPAHRDGFPGWPAGSRITRCSMVVSIGAYWLEAGSVAGVGVVCWHRLGVWHLDGPCWFTDLASRRAQGAEEVRWSGFDSGEDDTMFANAVSVVFVAVAAVYVGTFGCIAAALLAAARSDM